MNEYFGEVLRSEVVQIRLSDPICDAANKDLTAIARHNDYTMYVFTTLLFFLSGRTVRDALSFLSVDEINTGMIYFADKFRRPRTALRLVGAPPFALELVEHYNQHLLGLACALKREKPQSTDLRNIVLALHRGTRDTGTPYFFLISSKDRTETITQKKIELWWSPDRLIKSNIGRHWYASQSLKEGLSPKISAGQLGHYALDAHYLGRQSSLSINQAMAQQAAFTQSQIDRLGLKPLKGIPVYDSGWADHPNLKLTDLKPIHRTELGPVQRLKKRKKKKKEERVFVARLIKYLRARMSGLMDTDHEYETAIKAKHRSLGYPKAKTWAAYHRFIIKNPQAQSLSPIQGKPIEPRVEPNPITPGIVKRYADLERARREWINHLNAQKSFTALERIAAIIINAALLSGLTDAKLLRLLPAALISSCYRTQAILHLEIFADNDWLSRWEPDGLSAALIAGLSRDLARSKVVLNKKSALKVEEILRKKLGQIGLATSDDVFTSLQYAAHIQQRFEQPGVIAAQGPERRYANLLSIDGFIRLLTGKVPTTDRRGSNPHVEVSATTLSLPQISSPSVKRLKQAMRALTHLLSEANQDKKHGRLRGSKKRITQSIAQRIKRLQRQYTDAPQISHIALEWAQFLCHYGTIREESPAPSTLLRYIPIITNHVADMVGTRDIMTISSEEFEHLYESVLEVRNRDVDMYLMIFTHFHTFLMNAYGVPECEILSRPQLSKSALSLGCGNTISDADYRRALELVRSDQHISARKCLQYQGLLILMFQFGLRFGEAWALQIRDISIPQRSKSPSVQVRRRNTGSLKTQNASRQVNASRHISDKEISVLRDLVGDTPLDEHNFECCLFATSYMDASLISDSDAQRYLSKLLKTATGDPSTVLHTLRHSYITRNFANLIAQTLGVDQSYWRSDYCLSLDQLTIDPKVIDPFTCLSVMVGHSSLSVTANYYVRCKQLFPVKGDDPKTIAQIKKKSMAILLNESASNLRKRDTDFPKAISRSIEATPLQAVADDQYTEFDLEACVAKRESMDSNSICPATVEMVLYRLSTLAHGQAPSSHWFDISDEQLNHLLRISEEIEHETKFYVYQLFSNRDESPPIKPAQSAPLFRREHAQLQNALSRFEFNVLPTWNEEHHRTFVNGTNQWKRLIDFRHMDLTADREYQFTEIFSLAGQLGFRLKSNGEVRGKGKSSVRRQFLEYSFTASKSHPIGSLITHERTFHKLIFILIGWFETNQLDWRKL